MKTLVLICLLSVTLGYIVEKKERISDDSFQAWKLEHKKGYKDIDEEKVRYVIWKDNLEYVNEFNANNKNTKLGMNHFGDLTNTEFRTMMNGYRMSNRTKGSTFLAPANLKAPESVDWRTEGYVTPVKDQGQCGSCWAFSTTGSLEGQHFKKTGTLVSLSEQNLVDCSGAYGNSGCNGGLMDRAFSYIKANHGIDTEDFYPYTAKEGTRCLFNRNYVGASVTGYTDVTSGDETALKNAIAANGPVSVAIDASHRSFQLYKSGVYYEPDCSSFRLDHGVLAIGYGASNGQDYWLIKNSWGTSWGQDGYIWMTRNDNDNCGVAQQASFPQV